MRSLILLCLLLLCSCWPYTTIKVIDCYTNDPHECAKYNMIKYNYKDYEVIHWDTYNSTVKVKYRLLGPKKERSNTFQ